MKARADTPIPQYYSNRICFIFALEPRVGVEPHDLPITKRPNLAYVVVKYRCDASVLVHFRGFREASVQQFVQQPRGDVSRDYLASLRRSRTASTRIKMGRVPRSACSALRTRTCRYQSTSEPRPQRKKPSSLPPRTGRPVHGHSFPAESLRRSRRSRNL